MRLACFTAPPSPQMLGGWPWPLPETSCGWCPGRRVRPWFTPAPSERFGTRRFLRTVGGWHSTTRETGVSAIRLHEISTGKEIGVSSPWRAIGSPSFRRLPDRLLRLSAARAARLRLTAGTKHRSQQSPLTGSMGSALLSSKNGSPPSAFALPVTGGRIVSLHRRANVLYYSQRPTELQWRRSLQCLAAEGI